MTLESKTCDSCLGGSFLPSLSNSSRSRSSSAAYKNDSNVHYAYCLRYQLLFWIETKQINHKLVWCVMNLIIWQSKKTVCTLIMKTTLNMIRQTKMNSYLSQQKVYSPSRANTWRTHLESTRAHTASAASFAALKRLDRCWFIFALGATPSINCSHVISILHT